MKKDALILDDDDDEATFRNKILDLSGYTPSGYEVYLPHLKQAETKYVALKSSRAEQRKYVVDRILMVHKIREVNVTSKLNLSLMSS